MYSIMPILFLKICVCVHIWVCVSVCVYIEAHTYIHTLLEEYATQNVN